MSLLASHMESTWPLAEVKTSAGRPSLRRAAARSTISFAQSARLMTAIGSPPTVATGTGRPSSAPLGACARNAEAAFISSLTGRS